MGGGGLTLPCVFCLRGTNLAIWVLLMGGLTLPYGFCLQGGYPCHLDFAYGGFNLAT